MAIINAQSTYESPLTVVNTEANDVYLSALKRMGQVAADDLQRQKDQETERQKEANKWIQWTADNTLKNQGKAMDWMKEAGVNNPQLSSMIMEQINIMSELEGQARGASSPEEQRDLLRQVSEYKSRLASGMGVIGKMNDAITSYSEDATKSPNAEGNINLSNPKALEWAQQMAIISGKNPGKSNWFIDEDNDWARMGLTDDSSNTHDAHNGGLEFEGISYYKDGGSASDYGSSDKDSSLNGASGNFSIWVAE